MLAPPGPQRLDQRAGCVEGRQTRNASLNGCSPNFVPIAKGRAGTVVTERPRRRHSIDDQLNRVRADDVDYIWMSITQLLHDGRRDTRLAQQAGGAAGRVEREAQAMKRAQDGQRLRLVGVGNRAESRTTGRVL